MSVRDIVELLFVFGQFILSLFPFFLLSIMQLSTYSIVTLVRRHSYPLRTDRPRGYPNFTVHILLPLRGVSGVTTV